MCHSLAPFGHIRVEHTAYARIVDPDHPSGTAHTYRFNITHIFTPETNGSIHYWWFNSRDFKLDDPEADD